MLFPDDVARFTVLSKLVDRWVLRNWRVLRRALAPSRSSPLDRITAADPEGADMEFLVTMTTHVPDGTSKEAVRDVRTREAAHSRELAAEGHLLRLWRHARA